MRDLTHQTIDTIKIIILAVAVVLSVNYVFAAPWSGPTQAPTGGNVEPPVNVSSSSQIKQGALEVDGFHAYGGLFDGTLSVTGQSTFGDINAAAGMFSGAVSGTSLTATAGGTITGGQGVFSEGVTVGTSDGTFEYLQLDNKSGLGGFQEADCDAKPEGGRMFYDSSIGILYLCVQGRTTTAENGWKPVSVEYVPTQ